MLDPATAQALLDKGWARDGSSLTWKDELGSSLRLELTEDRARIAVFQDESPVIRYDLQVGSNRIADLIAALAARTGELAGMSHGGFSKDVATIASDAIVETTDGYLIRPRLENGELHWTPIGPKPT